MNDDTETVSTTNTRLSLVHSSVSSERRDSVDLFADFY